VRGVERARSAAERCRGLSGSSLHADLTILARLVVVLARAQAVPIAAHRLVQSAGPAVEPRGPSSLPCRADRAIVPELGLSGRLPSSARFMKNISSVGGVFVIFCIYDQLAGDAPPSLTDPLLDRAGREATL
jgi:hypothetical protein